MTTPPRSAFRAVFLTTIAGILAVTALTLGACERDAGGGDESGEPGESEAESPAHEPEAPQDRGDDPAPDEKEANKKSAASGNDSGDTAGSTFPEGMKTPLEKKGVPGPDELWKQTKASPVVSKWNKATIDDWDFSFSAPTEPAHQRIERPASEAPDAPTVVTHVYMSDVDSASRVVALVLPAQAEAIDGAMGPVFIDNFIAGNVGPGMNVQWIERVGDYAKGEFGRRALLAGDRGAVIYHVQIAASRLYAISFMIGPSNLEKSEFYALAKGLFSTFEIAAE